MDLDKTIARLIRSSIFGAAVESPRDAQLIDKNDSRQVMAERTTTNEPPFGYRDAVVNTAHGGHSIDARRRDALPSR